MTARAIIDRLNLTPHPEGGWYREVYRSSTEVSGPRGPRSAITTIYYLLEAAQFSRWHVVAADEIWHFYCGSPLELLAYDPASRKLNRTLLGDVNSSKDFVQVIEAGVWQAARPLGPYSLAGCSVGPGFDFTDFRFVSALPEHAHHFKDEMASLLDLL